LAATEAITSDDDRILVTGRRQRLPSARHLSSNAGVFSICVNRQHGVKLERGEGEALIRKPRRRRLICHPFPSDLELSPVDMEMATLPGYLRRPSGGKRGERRGS